jgi:hypothetical protein
MIYMDVNEHERIFNITLRHKLVQNVQRFYSVLHFTVKVDFSKMRITQNPKMSLCLLSSLHVETNTSISL